ncbi:hypothetical protein SAMD00023353_0800090 [Rosellinia necatrix]|uniref:Uncharacterized protein n=1 Tax=Rosellinia necatrix TaxID=77044 RepID=A0A1S8A687_ROSNE|nr:hypothetical protein SAMD00023353_0800090 [Rosellinia necatrix]
MARSIIPFGYARKHRGFPFKRTLLPDGKRACDATLNLGDGYTMGLPPSLFLRLLSLTTLALARTCNHSPNRLWQPSFVRNGWRPRAQRIPNPQQQQQQQQPRQQQQQHQQHQRQPRRLGSDVSPRVAPRTTKHQPERQVMGMWLGGENSWVKVTVRLLGPVCRHLRQSFSLLPSREGGLKGLTKHAQHAQHTQHTQHSTGTRLLFPHLFLPRTRSGTRRSITGIAYALRHAHQTEFTRPNS